MHGYEVKQEGDVHAVVDPKGDVSARFADVNLALFLVQLLSGEV